MIQWKKERHRDFFFIGILVILFHFVYVIFGIVDLIFFLIGAAIFGLFLLLKKKIGRKRVVT